MKIIKAGEVTYDAQKDTCIIHYFWFSGEDNGIGFGGKNCMRIILDHPDTKFRVVNLPSNVICKNKIQIRRFEENVRQHCKNKQF